MKSQTSLVASQVRLQHWAEQIKDCQNRPEDMDVKHGATRMVLPKLITTTEYVRYGKPVFLYAKMPVYLLLNWNSPLHP